MDFNFGVLCASGTGIAKRDLVLSQNAVNFEEVTKGNRSVATRLTITNRGDGSAMAMISLNDEMNFDFNDEAGCHNKMLDAGATCSFEVAFTPSNPGSHLAALTLSSPDAPVTPRFETL